MMKYKNHLLVWNKQSLLSSACSILQVFTHPPLPLTHLHSDGFHPLVQMPQHSMRRDRGFTSGLSWCFSEGELSSVRTSIHLWQGQALVQACVPMLAVYLESLYCLRGCESLKARNMESLLGISRQRIKCHTLWAFDRYLVFASLLLPYEISRFHHPGSQFHLVAPFPSSALRSECVFPLTALFST